MTYCVLLLLVVLGLGFIRVGVVGLVLCVVSVWDVVFVFYCFVMGVVGCWVLGVFGFWWLVTRYGSLLFFVMLCFVMLAFALV